LGSGTLAVVAAGYKFGLSWYQQLPSRLGACMVAPAPDAGVSKLGLFAYFGQ
jgi:hypothetical protein